MKIKNTVLALFALALLASCSSKKKINSEALVGYSWKLIELNGSQISYAENQRPVEFTLLDNENKTNGFAGCNNFMGTYTLKGDTLTFSPLATTRKACLDIKINESEVLKAFAEVQTITLKNNKLSFLNSKKEIIAVFVKTEKNKAEAATEKGIEKTTEIVEKYWKLKTLNGKTVVMDKNQQKESYFTLKAKDSRIVGFAGCNSFNGTYTLKGNGKISFSKMLTTLKACPGLKINEADFLKVFQAATSYALKDDQLVLKNEKQEILASFEAVYFN